VADLEEPRFLARYPFLPRARERVQSQGLALGDLLSDAAFERARRRGVQRVLASFDRDGIPESELADPDLELYSYPLARALVVAVNDDYLSGRYAVAESKLLSRRLGHEDDEVVWAVATDVGLDLEPDPEGFARLHFLDYLRNAPGRDNAWKLVNQPLAAGFVTLSKDKVVRLAEEALKERLREEIEGLERPGKTFAQAFQRDLNQILTVLSAHRARFQGETGGPVRPEAFPPCMNAIWNGIRTHVNVPHMGRFAIVSFLHALGMTSEDILRYFSTLPDFDANKSRYQIEHITGQIGATEYTPPSCSKMQTFGICPLDQRDEICLYEIHHPLSYYRKKVRRLPPPKPTPAPAEVTGGAPGGTA
jgi:DNA primase large subunit